MLKRKLISLLVCFGFLGFSGTVVSNNITNSPNPIPKMVTVNFGLESAGRTPLSGQTSFIDSENNEWTINLSESTNMVDDLEYTSISSIQGLPIYAFSMSFKNNVRILSVDFHFSYRTTSGTYAAISIGGEKKQEISELAGDYTISFSGDIKANSILIDGIASGGSEGNNHIFTLSYTYIELTEPTVTFEDKALGGFCYIGTGNEKTKQQIIVFSSIITETSSELSFGEYGFEIYSDSECKTIVTTVRSTDTSSLANKEFRYYTVYNCDLEGQTLYAKSYAKNSEGGIKYGSSIMQATGNFKDCYKVE